MVVSAGHVTSGPGAGNGGRPGFRSARTPTGAPRLAGPYGRLRQPGASRLSSIMGRADGAKPTHGDAVILARIPDRTRLEKIILKRARAETIRNGGAWRSGGGLRGVNAPSPCGFLDVNPSQVMPEGSPIPDPFPPVPASAPAPAARRQPVERTPPVRRISGSEHGGWPLFCRLLLWATRKNGGK